MSWRNSIEDPLEASWRNSIEDPLEVVWNSREDPFSSSL